MSSGRHYGEERIKDQQRQRTEYEVLCLEFRKYFVILRDQYGDNAVYALIERELDYKPKVIEAWFLGKGGVPVGGAKRIAALLKSAFNNPKPTDFPKALPEVVPAHPKILRGEGSTREKIHSAPYSQSSETRSRIQGATVITGKKLTQQEYEALLQKYIKEDKIRVS